MGSPESNRLEPILRSRWNTAIASATGKQLWEFQTGAGMNAPVTTFERNGKQYVLAYSAGNALIGSPRGDSVWLFGLDGTLPPAQPGTPAQRTTAIPEGRITGVGAAAARTAPGGAADLAGNIGTGELSIGNPPPSAPSVASSSMPVLAQAANLVPAAPVPPQAKTAQALPRLVNSTRTTLDYKIEGVGPSGVGKVEIWITGDGGKTWNRKSEDPDMISPAVRGVVRGPKTCELAGFIAPMATPIADISNDPAMALERPP